LARESDFLLNCYVEKEACPNNLAPTSSTTAQLVIGDALAMALLSCRGFTASDFAKYHPGGALGKRLYLKVSDLYPHNEKPEVKPSTLFAATIFEISSKRLGCTAVVDGEKIVGIVTDGDIRRFMQKQINDYQSQTASQIMSANPKTIAENEFAATALAIMRENSITSLLVTNLNVSYSGVIHLHDLISEGII
jgi:arabinose-5-phosphate isomerase